MIAIFMVSYDLDLTETEIDREKMPYRIELDLERGDFRDVLMGIFLGQTINHFLKRTGSNLQPAVYRFSIYGRAGIPITSVVDRLG